MEPAETNQSGLTRRRLLGQAGVAGAVIAGGGIVGIGRTLAAVSSTESAASALVLTPEQEEGPFYVALEKIRKNITLGRKGVPLKLRVKIVDSTTGKPVSGAALDIWHCDATGVYSDESSEGTVGSTWLRGVQITGADGVAEFESIYPGQYTGRDTHIHVKVHIGGASSGSGYSGGHVSHTGQLFFSDALSDKVYRLAPYTSGTAARTDHAEDQVWTQQDGAKSLLTLTPLGSKLADGFLGTITLGVNPAATPAAVGVGH
jgi:protocatechuate 3,4-dioxygenase beta subunit